MIAANSAVAHILMVSRIRIPESTVTVLSVIVIDSASGLVGSGSGHARVRVERVHVARIDVFPRYQSVMSRLTHTADTNADTITAETVSGTSGSDGAMDTANSSKSNNTRSI